MRLLVERPATGLALVARPLTTLRGLQLDELVARVPEAGRAAGLPFPLATGRPEPLPFEWLLLPWFPLLGAMPGRAPLRLLLVAAVLEFSRADAGRAPLAERAAEGRESATARLTGRLPEACAGL